MHAASDAHDGDMMGEAFPGFNLIVRFSPYCLSENEQQGETKKICLGPP